MVQNPSPSIVLIGAGNVGSALGIRLHQQHQNVTQVFSRGPDKAIKLAREINSDAVTRLSETVPDADLYILAVHDDAIATVAAELAATIDPNRLVVHTSGATPSTVLQPHFQRYGVFYPLQTFSLGKKPDWPRIPICLFANQTDDLVFLKQIASWVSDNVYTLDDSQRAAAHVAAVFANNFPNCLFEIANRILEKEGLPFDLIRPLILETAQKIESSLPGPMQTGPAARGDDETIERHIASLNSMQLDESELNQAEDWKKIYQILTDQIQKQQR